MINASYIVVFDLISHHVVYSTTQNTTMRNKSRVAWHIFCSVYGID